MSKATGRHDSGQTSTNPKSGDGGKHSSDKTATDRSDAGKLTSQSWFKPGKGEK